MQIKVKITDKYIYLYDKTLKILESKYIKNGRVDNVEKFIRYLRNILNNTFIKRKYIFILDPTLNNSELFVYKYVFDSIGLLNYRIINDVSIVKDLLNDDNIILFSWTSGIYYCYLNNNDIVVNKYNNKVINNLKKKYIINIGDTEVNDKFNKPIYKYEDNINFIFKKES